MRSGSRAWTADGRRYLTETLGALTGTRRQRFLLGLWAVGEGVWFDSFDPARHVTPDAEFDPELPAFLSVDPGVVTGAVIFQVRQAGGLHWVNVVGDYLSEGLTAAANAVALRDLAERLVPGKLANRYCDPAGGARNPIGPTVIAEYARAGLALQPWSKANPSVADSLALVEGLLDPVDGHPRLTVHTRCRHLISAFGNYARRKRAGQWLDEPEDPQHPAEDLIDALKGGLHARIPARKTLVVRKVGA